MCYNCGVAILTKEIRLFEKDSIGRTVLLIFIGTLIGTIFGLLVAYPALLSNTRENSARIEANKERIDLLWEAHYIQHDSSTKDGG